MLLQYTLLTFYGPLTGVISTDGSTRDLGYHGFKRTKSRIWRYLFDGELKDEIPLMEGYRNRGVAVPTLYGEGDSSVEKSVKIRNKGVGTGLILVHE